MSRRLTRCALSLPEGYWLTAGSCALSLSKRLRWAQAAIHRALSLSKSRRCCALSWSIRHWVGGRPVGSAPDLAHHQEVDQEDPHPGQVRRRDYGAADAAAQAWPRRGYQVW